MKTWIVEQVGASREAVSPIALEPITYIVRAETAGRAVDRVGSAKPVVAREVDDSLVLHAGYEITRRVVLLLDQPEEERRPAGEQRRPQRRRPLHLRVQVLGGGPLHRLRREHRRRHRGDHTPLTGRNLRKEVHG